MGEDAGAVKEKEKEKGWVEGSFLGWICCVSRR